MANAVSKNPSFRTDFQDVNVILVKSTQKNVLAQKTVLPNEIEKFKVPENRLFGQLFRMHFLLRSDEHFEISIQRRIFSYSILLIQRKKMFHLVEERCVLSMNFSQKCNQPLNIS
jgi:hypothetical protein